MLEFTSLEKDCLEGIISFKPFHAMLKQAFFESCLFMEEQTLTNKKIISSYYAKAIILIVSGVISDLHTRYSKEQLENYQNLVAFLEEKLLENATQINSFKQILIELQSKGYRDTIYYSYNNISKIQKNLPKINFLKPAALAMNKLLAAYKKPAKKTLSLFLWEKKILIIEGITFCILNSIMDAYLIPILIASLLAILIKVFEILYVNVQILKCLDKALDIEYWEQPRYSSPKKQWVYKLYVVPAKQSAAENEEQTTFFPSINLFPENINQKLTAIKSFSFRFWASSKKEQALSVDKNKIIPAFFGPAFQATFSNMFKKLEGGGLGAHSQLYGIWYGINLNVETRLLFNVFCEGKIVPPEKSRGIKLLSLPERAGKYYEIKSSGPARIIGKEFKTEEGKTLIVFVLYDPQGLHGSNKINQVIIDKVDLLINDLCKINLEPSLQLAM